MHKPRGKDFGGSPRIRTEISRLIKKIKAEVKPRKILLFGSYARGDYHEKSDVDLLVVGDFKERFFDRIGRILDCNDTSLGLDALAYTPQEFEKMRKQRNPLVTKALKEGIAL